MNSNVKTATLGRLAVSTAMLLSCVCVAAGALANEQVRSATVNFRDLNVGTLEGAQALFGRIHTAAKRVCSESDPLLQIGAMNCAKKAEADAIEKLNLPQLTAYYKSKNGDQTRQLIAAR
jgi:UrcA family protein